MISCAINIEIKISVVSIKFFIFVSFLKKLRVRTKKPVKNSTMTEVIKDQFVKHTKNLINVFFLLLVYFI